MCVCVGVCVCVCVCAAAQLRLLAAAPPVLPALRRLRPGNPGRPPAPQPPLPLNTHAQGLGSGAWSPPIPPHTHTHGAPPRAPSRSVRIVPGPDVRPPSHGRPERAGSGRAPGRVRRPGKPTRTTFRVGRFRLGCAASESFRRGRQGEPTVSAARSAAAAAAD